MNPEPPTVKAAVQIFDYDTDWPRMYVGEAARIRRAIASVGLAIEHVGSTAVPGLAAKPVIDIMVGVRHLDDAKLCVGPLAEIGYEYVPEYEDDIPDGRYFHKGPPGGCTHHLHMAEFRGDFWRRHLLFRDFLRSHPERAREYERLKRELAGTFGRDHLGYTEAKTAFIRAVEAEAFPVERSSSAT